MNSKKNLKRKASMMKTHLSIKSQVILQLNVCKLKNNNKNNQVNQMSMVSKVQKNSEEVKRKVKLTTILMNRKKLTNTRFPLHTMAEQRDRIK